MSQYERIVLRVTLGTDQSEVLGAPFITRAATSGPLTPRDINPVIASNARGHSLWSTQENVHCTLCIKTQCLPCIGWTWTLYTIYWVFSESNYTLGYTWWIDWTSISIPKSPLKYSTWSSNSHYKYSNWRPLYMTTRFSELRTSNNSTKFTYLRTSGSHYWVFLPELSISCYYLNSSMWGSLSVTTYNSTFQGTLNHHLSVITTYVYLSTFIIKSLSFTSTWVLRSVLTKYFYVRTCLSHH